MKQLYDLILEALRNHSRTVNNEVAFKVYLNSLKPTVINLRKSYKSAYIQPDYADPKTQAAYLIAYYPQYAEMTYIAVIDLVRYTIRQIL